MSELESDTHLTPASLLRRFADFKFKLCGGVQPHDQFLASQSGDCDDFVTLAADVLRKKGYHTRLIAVFMPLQTHVVCAVTEAKAYLDYNNRHPPPRSSRPTAACMTSQTKSPVPSTPPGVASPNTPSTTGCNTPSGPISDENFLTTDDQD